MSSPRTRVLVVEDSRTQALALRLMLERAGYEVETAVDGVEALEVMRQRAFETVISDLRMPRMDGHQLLEAMLADDKLKHIPLLVLSATTDDEVTVACIERGAVDYLYKPVQEVLLLARLRASLERKQMGDRERNYVRLVDYERRRAELLLYDVLPADIATRMKHGEQLIADAHDAVSVIFADLVGFTAYARGRPPAAVVRTLDALFTRFDELAASFGVEKIKTIGDGYMAASGLPRSRADHAEAAADFALALRETVRAYRTDEGVAFGVRLGIAAGPVVAGVIGERRHVYDLWGDTVNLASRMESAAPVDAIQITAQFAELLGEPFEVSRRGTVELKGTGPQQTFLLQSRLRGRRATRQASMARSARFEARRALADAERALGELELVDAATGLLTQRGFLPMAEVRWQHAQRSGVGVLALIIRALDPMSDGEAEALARLMRSTYRDTDLLVRWQPQTFAVIGLERSATTADVLRQRLITAIAEHPRLELPTLRMTPLRLLPAEGREIGELVLALNEAPRENERR